MATPITEDNVRHVAKLSRLNLTEEEIHRFTEQLGAVLQHIDQLSEVDVENVEPLAHPMHVTNVLREDQEQAGWPNEAMLANAPDKDEPFFKVIKVLGEGSGA